MSKEITSIAIEHVVVISNRPYVHVVALLEEEAPIVQDMDNVIQQMHAKKVSRKEASETISKKVGKSGFIIFGKINHGLLLSLSRTPKQMIQYTIGNPLLAVQMTEHVLAAALYAPFKLLIYEDEKARTIIHYDRFSSLLAQFHNDEVNRVAEIVDKKLEELVSAII